MGEGKGRFTNERRKGMGKFFVYFARFDSGVRSEKSVEIETHKIFR